MGHAARKKLEELIQVVFPGTDVLVVSANLLSAPLGWSGHDPATHERTAFWVLVEAHLAAENGKPRRCEVRKADVRRVFGDAVIQNIPGNEGMLIHRYSLGKSSAVKGPHKRDSREMAMMPGVPVAAAPPTARQPGTSICFALERAALRTASVTFSKPTNKSCLPTSALA